MPRPSAKSSIGSTNYKKRFCKSTQVKSLENPFINYSLVCLLNNSVSEPSNFNKISNIKS